jgi:CDP-diacylglycerol pyrophosphatase
VSRAAFLAALLAFSAPGPAAANRLAIWDIVHKQCVPAALKDEGLPKPCLFVDLKAGDGGDAVIKDLRGVAQLLDIPVTPVTGIEDARLLAPGAPHYFADAWRARDLMSRFLKAPLPRESVSLAVNARDMRSQDQLHFHVNCLRPDVARTLADYAPHFDDKWRPMTEALAGRKYFARRVDSADLAEIDPFRLLADEMPGAKDKMGQWSLAAVPLVFSGKPGFVLLADEAELTQGGHAEDIQDLDCAILR